MMHYLRKKILLLAEAVHVYIYIIMHLRFVDIYTARYSIVLQY